MSTNASISVVINDKVHTIYNHWDGYPKGVGNVLNEHYNTEERAKELISLGDVSSLTESVEKPEGHSFNTPSNGYSIFYGRDRNEKDTDARVYSSVKEMLSYEEDEFNYLFVNGEWKLL